jgi:ABC-2 type transport system permease protein/lipopolysaccharide transport system permease protein
MAAFQIVFRRFTDVSAHGAPYALFAAIGLVPWSFFSTAFSRGGTSLVANIPLLNKLYCPREVFPLASIALAMADGIASGLVLMLLFPITGFMPQIQSLWAPLLLLIAVVFTMGVTMAAASIVVYLRDLQVLLPLIVQFGLFVTPVGYGMDSVVTGTTKLAIFAVLNPLAPVIDGLRRTVLFGQAPPLIPTLAGAASALLWLGFGFVWFKRMEAGLADIA